MVQRGFVVYVYIVYVVVSVSVSAVVAIDGHNCMQPLGTCDHNCMWIVIRNLSNA